MRKLVAVAGALLVGAAPAAAQVTGPTYNAPYRAFESHEAGATVAFPDGGGTQLEGQYRFGYKKFDIGLRGGMFFVDGPGDDIFTIGVVARTRVLTHSTEFPLDGAIVFGGGAFINGGTVWNLPVGLSLGRRLDVEDSQVSIVPYVQPTLFIINAPGVGGRNTDAEFGVGFGADFRLSRVFDARVSVGVGNAGEGVSISAVWVR